MSDTFAEAIIDAEVDPVTRGSITAAEIVDDLIDMYSPVENECTFSFYAASGQVDVRFRILSDQADYKRMTRESTAWIREQLALHKKGQLPDKWGEVFTDDPAVLAEVFIMAWLAVDEGWRSQLTWLKLARRAGPLFRMAFESVTSSAVKTQSEQDGETVAAEKKS